MYTTTSDQESVPPVASISDKSNDSSISELQSEVQSLKDYYIHNMHGAYSMPMQPHPPFFSTTDTLDTSIWNTSTAYAGILSTSLSIPDTERFA